VSPAKAATARNVEKVSKLCDADCYPASSLHTAALNAGQDRHISWLASDAMHANRDLANQPTNKLIFFKLLRYAWQQVLLAAGSEQAATEIKVPNAVGLSQSINQSINQGFL